MKPDTLLNRLVPVLFEDEHLLAVDKPAGIDAGATARKSGFGLAELLADARGRGESFTPINRLSRYESGVLLLGKTEQDAGGLRASLRSNKTQREYVAVVVGKPRQARTAVSTAEGASRGRRGKRKPKAQAQQRVTGDAAPTSITLLTPGSRFSLVRCRTSAGTTHALRAQCRSVGVRLVGDRLHDLSVRAQRAAQTCLHLAKLTFQHAITGKRVAISCGPPDAFRVTVAGGRDVERVLRAALTRRIAGLARKETNAYRLLTGHRENLPGLVAERYGNVVLLQVLDARLSKELLRCVARWYRDILGVQAVYLKHFVKDRLGADAPLVEEMIAAKPFLGPPVPEQIEINERGLRFAIRPYAGFAAGLFLDQRENRARIRRLAPGREILNLFAYTCGFSVAAAAGNAAGTVSVDLSPAHLDWGKENFRVNGLSSDTHEFIRSDALGYLRRAARQGRAFDLVILDPPTFAHGRKSKESFSIARDLESLLSASVDLLRPGGVLLLSTNYRRLSTTDLRERCRAAARKRRWTVLETPRLPIDFAVDSDHSKSIIVRFE